MKKLIIIFSILFISCGQTFNSNDTNKDTAHNAQSDLTANNYTPKDSTIKVLWREDIYDTMLKDTVSTIILNDNYFKHISDAERAAIAYVATFVGSECDWNGEANDSFTNLNCKVIRALDLGYQCSDKHLNFLRHWFRNDTTFLKKLNDCPIIPFTATHQNTFVYLTIKTNTGSIKVDYEAGWTNGPEADSGEWTESILFKVNNGELIVLNKNTKNSS